MTDVPVSRGQPAVTTLTTLESNGRSDTVPTLQCSGRGGHVPSQGRGDPSMGSACDSRVKMATKDYIDQKLECFRIEMMEKLEGNIVYRLFSFITELHYFLALRIRNEFRGFRLPI